MVDSSGGRLSFYAANELRKIYDDVQAQADKDRFARLIYHHTLANARQNATTMLGLPAPEGATALDLVSIVLEIQDMTAREGAAMAA